MLWFWLGLWFVCGLFIINVGNYGCSVIVGVRLPRLANVGFFGDFGFLPCCMLVLFESLDSLLSALPFRLLMLFLNR